ncbi:MAG: glycosyltransferase [Acidobacteria bacterium]|nr:glycosyltransferase [Acidobacteriota bacterium]
MSPSVLMWEHHAWDSPIRVGGRAFAERFLQAGWSVAWINGPLAPWNLLGGNDEVARRRECWRRGGREIAQGPGRLFLYAPLAMVPYRRYPGLDSPWAHRHSLDGTLPSLWRILRERGFGRVDLLWLATGSPMLPLLRRVPHEKSLYRLSDDTSAFPDTPGSYRALEEEVLPRVDVVVATAASLAERASRLGSRVLLLPNGVDGSRFMGVARRDEVLGRPGRLGRIVYVGALDSWFDWRKVLALSRAFPEAEILLAGPIRMDISWAKGLPNVRLIGPVSPQEVPQMLAGSDVGIIPFVDSPLTRSIHPVKLYEYFAAGLPVVASDLDEIRRIGSPALLAKSEAEWVESVKAAWARHRREEALAFAAHHDWSKRFAALLDFLRESSPQAMRAGIGSGT